MNWTKYYSYKGSNNISRSYPISLERNSGSNTFLAVGPEVGSNEMVGWTDTDGAKDGFVLKLGRDVGSGVGSLETEGFVVGDIV